GRSEKSVFFSRIATHTCGILAMTKAGNGPDRSAKQPICSRVGTLLPPQTGIPEGSLPRGEGGPPLAAVDEGLSRNPKGSLPLMREVSPQVTEGEKSYSIKLSRIFIKNTAFWHKKERRSGVLSFFRFIQNYPEFL
ncbi:MAG: hypothetical protein IJM98_01540, partial [Oscillospiraceae bacterium]|nr:hypothetical protein [Oscillospiraceae bacterium]